MTASASIPVPKWAMAAAIGGLPMLGIAAYVLGMMKKKEGKMTKSERMFYTVTRVLSEEIDRLEARAQSDKETLDRERAAFDKRLCQLREESREVLEAQKIAESKLRVVEEQLAAHQRQAELAASKRAKRQARG